MERLRHPIRAIREPFGTAGLIVACVALVAALAGGAYAASGGLSAKQKKEVKKIAKQFAGKPGAPGAKGDTGAKGDQGAKGDTGAKGDQGTPGTNGTNGKDGEDGACSEENPVCTLPSEATETGVLGFCPSSTFTVAHVPVSFNLPLAAAPEVHVIRKDGKEKTVKFENEEVIIEENEVSDCPGSVALPEAEPGALCLYTEVEENIFAAPYSEPGGKFDDTASFTTGAVVGFKPGAPSGAIAYGTWAVTAE